MSRQAYLDAPGTEHHEMGQGIEEHKNVDDGRSKGVG
jgi:hypothetical protein